LGSELTRLRAAIEAEYQAASRGLYGPAVVGMHAILTRRAENLAPLLMACISEVGAEATGTMMDEFAGKYSVVDETAMPPMKPETAGTGSEGLPSSDVSIPLKVVDEQMGDKAVMSHYD
jgi:hypothetical protein